MVEYLPSKQAVAGSSPVSRSSRLNCCLIALRGWAVTRYSVTSDDSWTMAHGHGVLPWCLHALPTAHRVVLVMLRERVRIQRALREVTE